MINYGFTPSVFDGSEHVFTTTGTELPQSFSYRPYLTPILDQGEESICVPCSISAYLNWKINAGREEVENPDNSIDLHEIYRCRTNQGEGMSFKEALHFLRHSGVHFLGGVYRIEEYARLMSLEDLKAAIFMNGPCISALPVYNNGSFEFWNGTGQPSGYHAISLCGWDEKNNILVRNSWGTVFGDQGYIFCPYNKFIETWTVI